MNKLIEFLKGKKAYIIAGCMVAYGIGLILQGQTEQGIEVILSAFGLGALRAGISKVNNK